MGQTTTDQDNILQLLRHAALAEALRGKEVNEATRIEAMWGDERQGGK